MNLKIIQKYLDAIFAERSRQENLKLTGKFKYTCADAEMLQGDRFLVLGEEVGEVARAVLNFNGMAEDQMACPDEDLRKELIQVAAVCLAWLEGLDKPNIY